MSSGRWNGAVPLLTMVLSFLVVLTVGGWIGPEKAPPGAHGTNPTDTTQEPDPAAESSQAPSTGEAGNETTRGPGAAEVKLVADWSGDQDEKWEPFPGVVVTLKRLPAEGGDDGQAARGNAVQVCVDPPAQGWRISDPDTPDGPCTTVRPTGQIVVKLVRS